MNCGGTRQWEGVSNVQEKRKKANLRATLYIARTKRALSCMLGFSFSNSDELWIELLHLLVGALNYMNRASLNHRPMDFRMRANKSGVTDRMRTTSNFPYMLRWALPILFYDDNELITPRANN